MKTAVLGIVIFLFFAVPAVMADEGRFKFDRDKVYVGGGLSDNSKGGAGSSTGYQVFAGYHLDYLLADGVAGTALEVGFMDAGSFDVGTGVNVGTKSFSGIWITGMALLPMNSTIDLVGRIGLDLGDDDGVIFGFGVSYQLTPDYQLRGEYVLRNLIDSVQINVSTDVKSFM